MCRYIIVIVEGNFGGVSIENVIIVILEGNFGGVSIVDIV